jgi:murein DD-endopeptidase MepM/ murein hydrolase activator NlpD
MIPVVDAKVPTSGILSFMYFRGYTDDGTAHYHRGIDLAAPKGTPIFAAEGGVVTQAIDSYTPGFRGYGKTAIIKSPRGIYYLYAHMDRLDVRKDQQVRIGQQIGTVGYTAYTASDPTGDLKNRAPHLHFETSDNPYPKEAEADRLDPVKQLSLIPANGSVTPIGTGNWKTVFFMSVIGTSIYFYLRPRRPWKRR